MMAERQVQFTINDLCVMCVFVSVIRDDVIKTI